MDLTPVAICAIVFGAIYKIISLLVHRKERLKLIDKIVELPPEFLANKFAAFQTLSSLPQDVDSSSSRFQTLRWGCLLGGIGIGMVIGGVVMLLNPDITWTVRNMVIGGSVLLCGSFGLMAAFIIEYRLRRKAN